MGEIVNLTSVAEGDRPQNSSSGSDKIDQEASRIQWIIICSVVVAIAFGLATIMYVRKATNWEHRSKLRKMVKQRKREYYERRKIKRIKPKWQKPEEFLQTFDIRQAEMDELAQKRRPDPTEPNCHKQIYYEYENLRRRPPAGRYHYTSLKAFELGGKNIIKESLPYDHNRIRLPLDPTVPCSDYINGSFIDGYTQKKCYLAVQGPFEASIVDFWRTVWLYKVRCIVMLCEPFEFAARQCFRYWPDKSMSYDDIDVTCESVHRTLDFTYRRFLVTHVATHEEIEVIHFQYRNWPQFGQPDVYTFLQYLYLIRSCNPDLRPLLCHSKTGSDRTGLFIALDYCLESICVDNVVNIHESVRKVRQCRAGLVSTIEQYQFIHQAVRVFLLCGITEVPVRHLVKFAQLLGTQINGKQTTGYQQHYEILTKLQRHLTQNDSATGIMSENRWVSRDATCLPPDEYRAHLITGRKGCHDYINAVICSSCLRPNAFIVTQWPLLTTVKDFWRMIYDYGIVSTVVLSDVSTGIRYPKFWPVKCNKRELFDVVSVNLETKEKRLWGTEYSYTMRQWEGFVDMKSVLMKAGESAAAVPKGEGRTVSKWLSKLFLLKGWKPGGPHERLRSLVEVLVEVEKWQKEAGPEKFICVVSTDGIQQSGVFMTLYMAHEQMVNDFKVDLMSNALAVRRTRPQLLPCKEEYEYCWRSAAELQKLMQAEMNELAPNYRPKVPEVHDKPIHVLCTNCWYCKNKAKFVSSLGSSYNINQSTSSIFDEDNDAFVTFQKQHTVDHPEELNRATSIEATERERLIGDELPRRLTIIPPDVPTATFTLSPPEGDATLDAVITIPSTSADEGLLRVAPSTSSTPKASLSASVATEDSSSKKVTRGRRKAPSLAKASRQPAFSQRSDDETVF